MLPVSARECPKVPMLPNRILIHAGENRYILAATELVDRTFEGKDVSPRTRFWNKVQGVDFFSSIAIIVLIVL